MPSHFSTIGFPVANQSEYKDLAVKAVRNGKQITASSGTYIQWAEKNGAEIWVQQDKDRTVLGINPHFAGKAILRVGLIKKISRPKASPLDGAFYGWADPIDEQFNDGAYPFVFDAPDFLLHSPEIPSVVNVQISAFAHELQIYPDEKAFNDAGTSFAVESFIPSGLFTPKMETIEPPQAHAIFTGKVLQCSTFTNEFTNVKYTWALVRTLGGEIDVVADPSITEHEIVAGNVVQGSFWLSGRLKSA